MTDTTDAATGGRPSHEALPETILEVKGLNVDFGRG